MKRKILTMALIAGITSSMTLSVFAMQSGNSKLITKSEAKAIALQHAGLKESEVKFVNGYLDYDDGRAEYEIEFWKGNKEYDYEIDVITGNIISYDYDIESYIIPSKKPSAQGGNSGHITKEKAKAIALQHAGLKESAVKFVSAHLDYDDGRAEYEIEFRKGRTEYEYKVDAATGKIVECDMDYDD